MASSGRDPPPPRLLSIPKEGERILAPTRRPDGTLRKPVRIRAGYVPQDEVAPYQPKGAILRKESEPEVPPGYDPALVEKLKSKAAKRNERKKEKRHQAALEKEKKMDSEGTQISRIEEVAPADSNAQRDESLDIVTEQISRMSVFAKPEVPSSSADPAEALKPESSGLDLDKKIRAVKKKIRLSEAQLVGNQQSMKPEHMEKMRKVEGWREELKLLEDRKASSVS
ncbi:partner of Y14 and mago [Curcuma longa]|uniref:partner of Y14 and mago n=1 Tax=Curcuma longa TaxID=136217 RepID=UPI003D9E9C11